MRHILTRPACLYAEDLGPLAQQKTPIAEGRKRLKAASFELGPNTGARYEVWINRHGFPVNVSYHGRDNDNYATASLDLAITLKDECLN